MPFQPYARIVIAAINQLCFVFMLLYYCCSLSLSLWCGFVSLPTDCLLVLTDISINYIHIDFYSPSLSRHCPSDIDARLIAIYYVVHARA